MKPKKHSVIGQRRKARELAVQAVYQYDFGHMDFSQLENLGWMAGEWEPSPETVAYFKELLTGTLENLEQIDETIKKFAKKDEFDKMMPIDRAVLRMTVYCLIFEKSTPAVILINEGVELAKLFGGNDAHKFVNGVLDEVRKQLVAEGHRSSEEFSQRPFQK